MVDARRGEQLDALIADDTRSEAVSRTAGAPRRVPIGASRTAAPPDRPKIDVSVVHASLEYAQYPVMVGHFEGATLKGSEAFVDDRLDGLLSKRQLIGQYPQQPGHAVFLPPPRGRRASGGVDEQATFPPGAYVLGLGPPGELTNNTLVQSVTAALVDRGIELYELGSPDELVEFGVSSVLVGAFPIDGLTVEASLVAILEGLLTANDIFDRFESAASEAQKPTPRVRVTALEVIERYADRAELAAHAVRLLPHLLNRVEDVDDIVETTQVVVETRAGGLPYRPPLEEAETAWRRVMVTLADDQLAKLAAARDGAPPTLKLDVTVLGRLARADRLHQLVDCATVDNLVATAITQTSPNAQVTNTLWELLLPTDLKDGALGAGRIQLVVDERTANYPWEIMTSRGLPGMGTPLSLARAGLLRQFREGSGDQRFRVRRAAADQALVIGNPPVSPDDYPLTTGGYQNLVGATDEAVKVRDVLKTWGFTVAPLIWDNGAFQGGASDDLYRDAETNSGRAIINAIFKDDYRIIHVAAHGTVGDEPAESGAIIGGGMFLTANVIRQLPVVPDVVFLNCCHLAKVGFNQLAAGVARQLLSIGVQIVVAAGWAVDDRAAEAFADAFYTSLLEGRDYGDAVREARSAAHSQSPSLTWGAYQCYGDPGYRLTLRGGGPNTPGPTPVSRNELIREVQSIAVRAADVGRADTGELDKRRNQLLEGLSSLEASANHHHWVDDEVGYEFGNAYAKLGDNDHAVDWYRKAHEYGPAHPVALLEQLANREIRLAQEIAAGRVRTTDRRIADSPKDLVTQARRHLEEVDRLPKTAERAAVTASLNKKEATLAKRARRSTLLAEAASNYKTAYDITNIKTINDPNAPRDPYAALNWLQLASLAAPWPPTDNTLLENLGEVRRWLDDAPHKRRPPPRHDRQSTPDFWSSARTADFALTVMLVTPNGKGISDRTISEIADRYLTAFGTRSSWADRSSVVEHLRDLRTLAQGSNQLIKALDRVIERLDTWEREHRTGQSRGRAF